MIPTFQFRDPLFRAPFTVFVSDYDDAVTYMRDRGIETDNMGGPQAAKTLLLVQDGASEVLLWFPPDFTPRTPEGMGLLAHEALHAVHFTLRHRGVEDSSVLDEVGNYFLEWLVREIAQRCP